MKYLVICPCGHGLDRHESDGCTGEGPAGCRCGKSAELALEAAVDAARATPWGNTAYSVEGQAESA